MNGFFADILHQDRRAFDCRLISDAAAHDPGAQHGRLLHVLGNLVVALGFLFQLLIVQEQADQTLRGSSLGHFHETGGFDFQRLVTTEVGGFLDGLDGFDRGRIVRAGLTCDEALGGFECHHLFDGIELELVQLRLTLGLVIELAGNGALDQIKGGGLQLVGRYHCVHGTDLESVFRSVFLARGNPLDRVVGTNDAWQTHGAAETRVQAQLDLGQTDASAAGNDSIVCGQAHFQTAA